MTVTDNRCALGPARLRIRRAESLQNEPSPVWASKSQVLHPSLYKAISPSYMSHLMHVFPAHHLDQRIPGARHGSPFDP
jgi:hypothetical protein